MVEASEDLVPLTSDNERGFVRERGVHGVGAANLNVSFVLVDLIRRLLGLCVLRFVDVSEYVLFRRRIFYPSGWVPCSVEFPCASVFVRVCVCVCVRASLVSDMMPRQEECLCWSLVDDSRVPVQQEVRPTNSLQFMANN